MASFDEIVSQYRVDRIELKTWIEQRWVRPASTDGGLEFDAVDAARVSLIRELRRDLMLEDDALGLVLSLLDQLYAARQVLKTVDEAIEALPEPLQREVRERLRRPPQS